MYKILMADDESIVLESLQFIIRRSFEGECELMKAKNGRQAIEIAESFRPDIVLMDIHMPGINGLKAMEEILRTNGRIRFLILTAYNNFDYAKEAVRLGAVNYLMKPINKNVLVEQLSAVMREIDQERESRKEALSIQEKMEAVVPVLENGFVVSLFMQNDYPGDGEPYRSLLGIEAPYGIMMVMEWGEGRSETGMGNPVRASVMAYQQENRVMETVRIYFKAYFSQILGNRLVCVLPVQDAPTPYEERLSIIEKTRSMRDALGSMLSADVRVGIGSARSWDEMGISYHEAMLALRRGKRSVTHTDDLNTGMHEESQARMEDEVLEAVRTGRQIKAQQEAAVYAGWLTRQAGLTLDEARMRMIETLALAARMTREQGAAGGGQHDSAALLSCMDEEMLRGCFTEAIATLADGMVGQKSQREGPIERAQSYIRQNFKRSITLEQAAREADISPYYFSKLFKEETGRNFSDYLTDIRIDTAKRMLAGTDSSIKTVCVESGFANPNYFSRIFKKCTGLTPTEYRDAAMDTHR